jgi:hypothetical protein
MRRRRARNAAMDLPDVRRLAALDLHGLAGRRWRRRVIAAEFLFGATGCLILGIWLAATVSTVGPRILGAWIAGLGVNYLVLTWQAAALWRRGALAAELAGADVNDDLRRYSYLQFWIVVPILFAVLALTQHRQ